jgi:hypothetical protein
MLPSKIILSVVEPGVVSLSAHAQETYTEDKNRESQSIFNRLLNHRSLILIVFFALAFPNFNL